MKELTVRERVKAIQVELRDSDITPARAREVLIELTALLGNVQVEVTRTESAYTQVLARELDIEQKANRATIRAQLSPEYTARQEARNTQTLVVELIRSLKIVIKSIEEEMRLSR